MNYDIYKLRFLAPIHVGMHHLHNTENTICADTLFSALCIEARHQGTESLEQLIQAAKIGELFISDLLPYIGDELYLPKPLYPVMMQLDGDSIQKKKFKKLNYVPLSEIKDYFNGKMDCDYQLARLNELGKIEIRTMSFAKTQWEKSEDQISSYEVGTFRFGRNGGLYVIVGWREEKVRNLIADLMKMLGYSGIGGKKSAGLGRFQVNRESAPEEVQTKLNSSHSGFTLSTSMARPDELPQILDGARYLLLRRGGYVSSETYADSFRRKKEFYVFKAGSYFSQGFEGDVFNVGAGGNHPVYRYAKPMFLEVLQ